MSTAESVDISKEQKALARLTAARDLGGTALDLRRQADVIERSIAELELDLIEAPEGHHFRVTTNKDEHPMHIESWELCSPWGANHREWQICHPRQYQDFLVIDIQSRSDHAFVGSLIGVNPAEESNTAWIYDGPTNHLRVRYDSHVDVRIQPNEP
jgi:hypothetical protein